MCQGPASGKYNSTCHLDLSCECIKSKDGVGRSPAQHGTKGKLLWGRDLSNSMLSKFGQCLLPFDWRGKDPSESYPCTGMITPRVSSAPRTTSAVDATATGATPTAPVTPSSKVTSGNTSPSSSPNTKSGTASSTQVSQTLYPPNHPCEESNLYCDVLCDKKQTNCKCDPSTGETTAECGADGVDVNNPNHPCANLVSKCTQLCGTRNVIVCSCQDSNFPRVQCAPLSVVASANIIELSLKVLIVVVFLTL